MRTRYRFAIVSIVTALLCPALVFAADSPPDEGTWSALIFYAINFSLFIWIVKRVGGPQISEFFKTRATGIRENMSRADQAFKDAQGLAQRARRVSTSPVLTPTRASIGNSPTSRNLAAYRLSSSCSRSAA